MNRSNRNQRQTGITGQILAVICASTLLLLAGCYHPNPPPFPSAETIPPEPEARAAGLERAEILPTVINEEDAVRLALANDRVIELFRTDVLIADQKAQSAGKIDNPELRIGQLSSRNLDQGFRSLEVGVRWRSPRIGELAAQRDIASAKAQLKQADMERFRQEFASGVRKTCIEIAHLAEMIRIYDEKIEARESKVSMVDDQIALGERTSLDLTEARLELFQTREERDRLATRLSAEKAALASYMGTDEKLTVVAVKERPLEKTLGQLQVLAHRNRPELQQARSNYMISQARAHLERSKAVPWISFVEPSYRADIDEDDNDEDHWAELRFGVDLPIFDRNRGRIRAEELASERHATDALRIKEEIDRQVADAFNAWRDLYAGLDRYERESAELLSNAEFVLNNASEYAAVNPTKIVDLKLRILDIHESLVNKRRMLANARTDLYAALGVVFLENLEDR